MKHPRSLAAAALLASALLTAAPIHVPAQPPGPPRAASFYILTTGDGANLPAAAEERDFPVLLRLHRDCFDFGAAAADGSDVRFATPSGQPLAHAIDEWDAAAGVGAVWVRIPVIRGQEQQEVRMHWGGAGGPAAAGAVFSRSNGFLSVWHLGASVRDAAGTLESKDTGTTPVPGVVGAARHFPGGQGVFGGERIPDYPAGTAAHSTEAWFRAEKPNTTLIGWGNEGGGRGSKVRMQLRSPPHLHVDSDFCDVKAPDRLPLGQWIHVVHTHENGEGRLYLNGQLAAQARTALNIRSPARLWLGGWYHRYDFVGALDEVRISQVARSPDWVRLAYENQKPLGTLVGPLVRPGTSFAVSPVRMQVREGGRGVATAVAGGARKIYWILQRGGVETVLAVDRLQCEVEAGRVTGDQSARLQLRAVLAEGVLTRDIPIVVREAIPDPAFTLSAPASWDGRQELVLEPRVTNQSALAAAGGTNLVARWTVTGLATTREVVDGRLRLRRAHRSGPLQVSLALHNGGGTVTQSVTIEVREPRREPWVVGPLPDEERPVDNQFFARNDRNEGIVRCRGRLEAPADAVFLRLHAEGRPVQTVQGAVGPDRSYTVAVPLAAGLVRYRVEFGSLTQGRETLLHTATNLVCGDVLLIQGQSNALATDTAEKAAADPSDWIRSFGSTSGDPRRARRPLWGPAIWKDPVRGGELEVGYWGMELGRRLVASRQVPVCILNGAVGGTRIDQHQRNPTNAEDVATIYGRLLWRVREAGLADGVRAILWHQGENDQGADGPTGGYGWETYQQLFIDLLAGWKQDYPNVAHYYVFQIWPHACAMGAQGSDNRLREVQRTLPTLVANLDVLSTLGIQPPGGCHYPLAGWAEFARLVQPLIERDLHGVSPRAVLTPPNLQGAAYAPGRKQIELTFDQPVTWTAPLAGQFHLDGQPEVRVVQGEARGERLLLQLSGSAAAGTLTYLDSRSWNPTNLLRGANGQAALTFCGVPIREP
ncbi:MAG: hypothetical protein RJA22_1730 [Verrucomicrobiota bacterium]